MWSDISILSPCAGRDRDRAGKGVPEGSISIHSPRAGRDRRIQAAVRSADHISIHSPRAGRDAWPYSRWPLSILYFNPLAPCGARLKRETACLRQANFNPLAPCGARRRNLQRGLTSNESFQSTRPVRGETPSPRRSEEHTSELPVT